MKGAPGLAKVAKAHASRKEWAEAARAYEQFAEISPSPRRAYLLAAECWHKCGKAYEFRKNLERSLKKASTDLAFLSAVAASMKSLDQWEDLLDVRVQQAALSKQNPIAWSRFATDALIAAARIEALPVLVKRLDLDHFLSEESFVRVWSGALVQKVDINCICRLLDLFPKESMLLNALVFHLHRARRWSDMTILVSNCNISNMDGKSRRSLMRAYDELGRFSDARTFVEDVPPNVPAMQVEPTSSTLFFRNFPLLKAIRNIVNESTRELRLHVAAVSSGEEVYSIAMLLAEAGLLENVRLSASDIDEPLIRKARAGVYPTSSLRQFPDQMKKYARVVDEHSFEIIDHIKHCIQFDVTDILNADIKRPGAWHIVVANNVLIHFNSTARDLALRNLSSWTSEDGALCVGGVVHGSEKDMLKEFGLFAVQNGSREIYDAWDLQRNAWYLHPRPYWAIPPFGYDSLGDRCFSTFFAKSQQVRESLETVLGV